MPAKSAGGCLSPLEGQIFCAPEALATTCTSDCTKDDERHSGTGILCRSLPAFCFWCSPRGVDFHLWRGGCCGALFSGWLTRGVF